MRSPWCAWFDVSPDGRLLAFTDASGNERQNVFVTTLPDLRERRQVTSNGGSRPKFASGTARRSGTSAERATAGATRGQLNVVP